MEHFHIASADDVRDIEQRPYDELVPWRSVLEAIEDAERRDPDRFALTHLRSAEPPFAPERFTRRQFAGQVRRAANLFRRMGIGPSDTVAILLPSIPSAYFALYGAETAGRACPINFLLGADHIADLVDACRARVLVALGPHPDLDIWTKAAAVRARCKRLEHVFVAGETPVDGIPSFEDALALEDDAQLAFEREARRDAIAAFFHTGGTTGTPKLAQHTHGNQVHVAWGAAQMFDMRPTDVIVNGFPLFHVAGSFVYGLSALLAGAEVVLPTLLGMRNATLVRNYWRVVETFGATVLAGVPTVISSLMATPVGTEDIRSIRCMLTGGSPLPTELANAFEAKFGRPVRNIFGMTESAGVISIVPFHGERRPLSCGLPLPYCRVKAVDAGAHDVASASPLPPGATGVIVVGGPNVSPGYTDPRRDAGTFDGGWLVSGDLGHVAPDGEVFVTGRAKDIIIRGAHNIDPGEIENALMRHPAVQVAAAVGEPDEYAGELPIAFVVLKPGHEVDEQSLIAFVRPLLTERPAWPKRITAVDAIPMTAVGKIYKPSLRALAVERVVRERAAERCPVAAPAIACKERGGRLLVSLSFDGLDRERATSAAKAIMGTLALDHEVVVHG